MNERFDLPDGLPDEAYELGEPTDEFAITAGRAAWKMTLGVVMLVLGILGVGLTVLLLVFGADHPGNAGAFRGLFVLGALSVALIFAGIAIPIRLLKQQGLRVLVCPDGLVWLQEEGEVIRWDDVETLRKEVNKSGHDYRGIYPLYKVRRRSDGREFLFDNFLPRLPQLARLIEKKTLKHLLPPELEALDDGELLRFGRVRVSSRGIEGEKEILRWRDVKDVTLDTKAGQIVIAKEGKWLAWAKYPINEVPNYHVFLALARDELANRG